MPFYIFCATIRLLFPNQSPSFICARAPQPMSLTEILHSHKHVSLTSSKIMLQPFQVVKPQSTGPSGRENPFVGREMSQCRFCDALCLSLPAFPELAYLTSSWWAAQLSGTVIILGESGKLKISISQPQGKYFPLLFSQRKRCFAQRTCPQNSVDSPLAYKICWGNAQKCELAGNCSSLQRSWLFTRENCKQSNELSSTNSAINLQIEIASSTMLNLIIYIPVNITTTMCSKVIWWKVQIFSSRIWGWEYPRKLSI